MGIRLETVTPDRRFIICLGAARIAAALICWIITGWAIAQPVRAPSLRWSLYVLVPLFLGFAFFIAGLKPFVFLTRFVEFYEDGISFGQSECLLSDLMIVCFQEDSFRLFGCIPLSCLPERRMYCFFRARKTKKGRQKKPRRRVCLSERYYPGLMDAFERAYEYSVLSEYRSKKHFLPPRPPKGAALEIPDAPAFSEDENPPEPLE